MWEGDSWNGRVELKGGWGVGLEGSIGSRGVLGNIMGDLGKLGGVKMWEGELQSGIGGTGGAIGWSEMGRLWNLVGSSRGRGNGMVQFIELEGSMIWGEGRGIRGIKGARRMDEDFGQWIGGRGMGKCSKDST